MRQFAYALRSQTIAILQVLGVIGVERNLLLDGKQRKTYQVQGVRMQGVLFPIRMWIEGVMGKIDHFSSGRQRNLSLHPLKTMLMTRKKRMTKR